MIFELCHPEPAPALLAFRQGGDLNGKGADILLILMDPISSRNTREGEAIFSSFLAAFTAARAADCMALTTPERPALMPAFRPAIALVPMDFRLVAVRLRETAFFANLMIPHVSLDQQHIIVTICSSSPAARIRQKLKNYEA